MSGMYVEEKVCLYDAILVRRFDCGEKCLGPDLQCPR